eukprot:scaffold47415_cov13-Tisochrysis_lutea.AAC.1
MVCLPARMCVWHGGVAACQRRCVPTSADCASGMILHIAGPLLLLTFGEALAKVNASSGPELCGVPH